MRYVILVLACLLVSSCGPSSCARVDVAPSPAPSPELPITPLPGPEAPKPGKDGKVDPLEQAKFDVQRYSEAAAQAEARYKVLKRQADEERLSSQVAWITGICLLLAAVAGVAAFLVPVGKKTVAAAAVGFATIAACAQAFQWAVPYLPWIGGAVIVGGGIWAVVNWRKLADTVKTAADHGDRLEDWFKSDLIAKLPADLQAEALKLIADAKGESKTQAERLGVHRELQTLRGKVQTAWQRLFDK